jgi:hypothetical protein
MVSRSKHTSPVGQAGTVPPSDDIDFAEDTPPDTSLEPAQGQSEIAMVLGPLLQRPGGLRDGSVYVLGLRHFKEFFGPRWPDYASKVYEAVEHVIADEIAPSDVYARVGGETYVIAFSRESETGAGLKAALIARRVKHKLFGQNSDLEMEIHALGRGGAAAEAGAASPSHEFFGPRAEFGALPETPTQSDFVFVPIWDAYHKILSTYACLPVGTLRSGRMRFGHELLAPGASDIERAEFDRNTFNFVAEVADDLHRNHFAVLVTFAVDYTVFGSAKSRESLLSAFRTLPKHLTSLITLQIANAPGDVAPTTLAERVALVRPYFRAVTHQVRHLDQDFQRYAYMGLHGLLYRLWDWDNGKALDPDQISNAIRQAKAARLQFAFSGVPDLKTAKLIADAGATYLSGPFLGAALDMPANMRRFTLEELGAKSRR